MREDLSKYSETELLLQFRKTQDNSYITEAILRYTPLLFSICLKYISDKDVAKDILQDVLIKGIERLPLKIDNLGGWLYMITRNECINYLRINQKTIYQEINPDMINDNNSELTDDELHWKKVNDEDLLIEAVNKLKEQQKKCVQLFYFENKTYQEIELLTNMSYNEIKSNIQNGKRNIKLIIEQLRRNEGRK